MRIFFIVVTAALGLMIASCNNNGNDGKELQGTVERPTGDSLVAHSASDSEFVLPAKDTSHVADMNWRDSLVVDYITNGGNAIVKATRKEGLNIEWMDNGMQETDSANYYTYQLGHSFEGRFVTDAWIYIDSAKRKLFEYDVAEEKLLKWK